MRASRFTRTAFALALAAALSPSAAFAQAPQEPSAAQALRAEIDQLKKDFDARLVALEARLAAISGGEPVAPPPATAAVEAAQGAPPVADAGTGALPVYGAPSASKVFNPDIAVIGNFLGAAGRNLVQPAPALHMAESEVSLQAVVDPYARADFFMSFGEQGVDLEEGFLTFHTLPAGLLMKVGKMRADFGKVNTRHRHVLPWADRPLVTQNLLGGEEGLSDAGISIAHLVSNPWIFLEATGQLFRGDSGEVFTSSRRGDLSYVGHLRGYKDLSESTNLELGTSFSRGYNDSGRIAGIDPTRFTTHLFGVDATLRWRPLQRAIYHSFIGRSELVWSQRQQPGGRQDAAGFFVSGDYQLGRRWLTGLRLDRSDRADDAAARDSGAAWTLTYAPSEFSQVRGQARRVKYAEGVTANEFLFQFQFAIGAHGAHPF